MQLQHQNKQHQQQQQETTNQTNYVILNEDIDRKQKQHTADVNEKLTKLFESINANKRNYSIDQELNNENNLTNFNKPFKITPLLICTNENNSKNKISITKNICNCNFCLLNLAYLNKNCFSHLESNKNEALNLTNKFNELNLIDYIDLNSKKAYNCPFNSNTNRRNSFICTTDRHRSSTPQISLDKEHEVNFNQKEIQSKCLGDEPIIYIDSIELDENLSNNILNNSNMNSFLSKLKSKHRLSSLFTEKIQDDATKSSTNKSTGNHDYHVIDQNTEVTATSSARKVKLSPSNSVQSFEFIDHTQQNVKCQLDETVKSYEKSWENSATFLMEKLDKCLKQEQQQHMENKVKIIEINKNCTPCFTSATPVSSSYFLNKPTLIPIKSITPIKLNCSLREKKLNALRNINSNNLNRKSFHGQACGNEMSKGNLIVNNQQKHTFNSPKFTSVNG